MNLVESVQWWKPTQKPDVLNKIKPNTSRLHHFCWTQGVWRKVLVLSLPFLSSPWCSAHLYGGKRNTTHTERILVTLDFVISRKKKATASQRGEKKGTVVILDGETIQTTPMWQRENRFVKNTQVLFVWIGHNSSADLWHFPN